MICPNCKVETAPTFFCDDCGVYLSNISAGVKAGLTCRLMALLLDGLLIWVIFFVILLAGIVAGTDEHESRGGFLTATFFLAAIAYTALSLWFLFQGKTLGKWLLDIGVVHNINGNVPGLGRMLVREIIGKFFSGLFFGTGYLWAIWDRNGQTWHDKLAGTLVVGSAQLVDADIPAPAIKTSTVRHVA